MRVAGAVLSAVVTLGAAGCLLSLPSPPPDPRLADILPVADIPRGEFRHPASGTVFRDTIGHWKRSVEARTCGAGDRGVDVGYEHPGTGTSYVARVLVLPSPDTPSAGESGMADGLKYTAFCSAAWAPSRDEVLRQFPGSRLMADEEVMLLNGQRAYAGRKGTVENLAPAGGGQGPHVVSHLYQFRSTTGRWIIEYRFLVPTVPGEFRTETVLDELLEGVLWP